MNARQWEQLLRIIAGEHVTPLPTGFIIDSPWLPGWANISILDYYTSESRWLEANLAALRAFPDTMFLPGFWSEFGMCTEPSAFGTKCIWHHDELPFADKILTPERMTEVTKPDVRTSGLLPFMLKRLQHTQAALESEGHAVRFAVARGPLNIASFLLGTTEFLLAMKEQPHETHALLAVITDFLCDWVRLQKETFPSIDGVFVLDDIVGFVGKPSFTEFVHPYLGQVFGSIDAAVRFLHNDAKGLVCAPFLAGMGVNLFNFSFMHGIDQMHALTDHRVTLLGNLPPRDVLAKGTPDEVRAGVRAMLVPLTDRRHLIASCGGGMSPSTPTGNIRAFIDAVAEYSA